MDILIVNSIFADLRMLDEIFSKYGKCTTTQDVVVAEQKIHQAYLNNQSFDIIIINIDMPRISGLELLDKIQNNESLLFIKPAKKILIAEKHTRANMLEIANKKADAILTKPIEAKFVHRILLNLRLISIG